MPHHKESFRNRVYELAKQIPLGKVATYGQLAKLAGSPRAARAVGSAMRHNPYMPVVPCHRVVGSDGSMNGYSGKGGVVGKKQMLLDEGVEFSGDKVNLSASLWKKSSLSDS